MMPILTVIFFGFNVYLKQIPYPVNSQIRGSHYTNICESEDAFSGKRIYFLGEAR